jgi:hypothetical protein
MDNASFIHPFVDFAGRGKVFGKQKKSETQDVDEAQKIHFLMPPAPLMRVPQVLHPWRGGSWLALIKRSRNRLHHPFLVSPDGAWGFSLIFCRDLLLFELYDTIIIDIYQCPIQFSADTVSNSL